MNKEDALRWLEQAEHNLEVAKINLNSSFYSDACFMAEQSAQVALKAFIIYHKRRYVWEHSIQELARMCSRYEEDFENFVEGGMILDRYYIPTRYPDALARPAVPYRSYLSKDAQEAINIVTKIVERVKREIEK